MGCWLVCSASAQDVVRWQVNLETAKRMALQANRMVLVHFSADWCQTCKEMEQEVLSRPEVVAALEAGFVPVEVNAEYFPHTCQQYGVSVLPTDIILTPQGDLVGRIEGRASAPQYLAYLSQAGATARRVATAPAYGGMPSGLASTAPQQTAAPWLDGASIQRPVNHEPSSPQYSDGRYAEYSQREQQTQTAQPSLHYGGQSPPISGGSPLGLQQSRVPIPTRSDPSGDWAAAAAAQPVPVSPSPSARATGLSASGIPQGPGVPLGSGVSTPVPSRQLPPGNPPFALDGYCPVRLAEHERWVPGDPRWGLIHRGRTYLFAGPEERDRFDADPDRFAPVLSGNDLVLLAEEGRIVPGRREHGAWFEGQLEGRFEKRVYLFSSEDSLRRFDADPYRYVTVLAQSEQGPMPGAPPRSDLGPAGVAPGGVPVEATRPPFGRPHY